MSSLSRGGRFVALGSMLFLASCLGEEAAPDASTSGGSSSSGSSSGGSHDAGTGGGGSSSGSSSGGSRDAGTSGGESSSSSGGPRDAGTSGGGSGSSSGGPRDAGTSDGGSSSGGSSSGGEDAVKSAGCGTATTAKSGNGQSITVGGSSRKYNLRIPDNYDKDHPYRLIVSYHPLGGTADGISNGKFYNLWDLANGSTVFVAPQGTGNAWNNSGGADVEFSRQLITQLETQLCIDKSRIFCEGFSMGGSMSYAMACGMGDAIRAVAVHSGGTMSGCASHNKPVAYFMTHGINDSVCKYPGFALPPLQDFAKMNGCTTTTSSLPTPTDSTGKTSACLEFEGCKDNYPVRACLFVGDHTPSPGGGSSWVPGETWKFITRF